MRILQQPNNTEIEPVMVYSKLELVWKGLVRGQQEDAHECLRYLWKAMNDAYNAQFNQNSVQNTLTKHIFGGKLESNVRCVSCNGESKTNEYFEELLLNIEKASTLDEALDMYFARTRIDDYMCSLCNNKLTATKKVSLVQAPISLCIVLNRFSITGKKVNKDIKIPHQLKLSKYLSESSAVKDQQPKYRLVLMVTHYGASSRFGHYKAIGLTQSGSYYEFDDSDVQPISAEQVAITKAYIIFYALETATHEMPDNNSRLRIDDRIQVCKREKLSLPQNIEMHAF